MRPFPPSVPARLSASGGAAAVSLLEVQTVSGNRYFWSDSNVIAPSVLGLYYPPAGGVIPAGTDTSQPIVNFAPWIYKPPSFTTYRTTQTATGSVDIQNISGDSIRRDTAQIFNKQELTAALIFYRLWSLDCEYSLFDFQGNVDDCEIDADGETMTLSIEGFCAWSKITAPNKQIGVSCPLTFGSNECGSTAPTPCNNSYGTCSSTNRFEGVVLEWNGAALNYSQYVQPQPLRLYNGRQAG